MEIKKWNGVNNLNKGYMSYQKITSQNTTKTAAETGAKPRHNVDKMEFDFSRVLEAAKMNVASEVNASSSSNRLTALATDYSGEQCKATSKDTAERIVRK